MHHNRCYIAEIFPRTAHALIGYFEVTWHLTLKLFPTKSLWAGNSAKYVMSESRSALLPTNVDQWPPLLLPLHWDSWETKSTVSLGTSHYVFSVNGVKLWSVHCLTLTFLLIYSLGNQFCFSGCPWFFSVVHLLKACCPFKLKGGL